MKVAQLAAYVSEKTSYHHGETSLADTIVKLAHDCVGSNNMNLLEPSGQFGTRLMGGKDCSQTRYIYTKLCPVTRLIFDKHDDNVLSYLMDDGKSIEPDYFVPVVPMVLVNGSEGIGTGFSSYVPPYSPSDIVENIQLALSGKPMKPMNPWFRGFRGVINKSDETTWTACGTYTCEGTTYRITELPPGRWTQDFKEYLDTLVEKKVITSYENNSTTEQVNFSIYGYTGTTPVKDFKMEKVFHTTNMHLFHPVKGIRKYASAEEILVDFLEIRIDYYKKRKEYLVKTLTEELSVLQNKARFIQMVIDGSLTIFKRNRSDIERDLKSLKFDGPSYDYLFNIKTYQYTSEHVEKLNSDVKVAKDSLESVQSTTTLKMWKSDLLKMSSTNK
jgi:DNA topoisomerase-2